jgi:hypothetical protein
VIAKERRRTGVAKGELRSGDAVLTVVADRLESGAKWVPTGSLKEGGASQTVPTLRSHLLEALGCDARAGALAYWDWEELWVLVGRCWDAMAEVVGPQAELWSNAGERTVGDVVAVLRKASSDVVVPAEPFERRPWALPTVVRTCRIPFVPVASVTQVWLTEGESLGPVLERLAITSTTGPWDVLRAADPIARDLEVPAGLREVADQVRSSMVDRGPAQYSPAVGLHAVAAAFDGIPALEELKAWAKQDDRRVVELRSEELAT